MTADAEAVIGKFFDDYASATLKADAKAIASAYGKTYIEASPASVTAYEVDADYRKALAEKSKAMTDELGLSAVSVAVKQASEFAPAHWLVETEWTMMFGAKKSDPARSIFRISYVVRLEKNAPTILLYVSHEDEDTVMKRDGVL